jgi:hypothetical protein
MTYKEQMQDDPWPRTTTTATVKLVQERVEIIGQRTKVKAFQRQIQIPAYQR